MNDRVYMDHHATTPTDPAVLEAMLPYFTDRFGNPASQHTHGREAAAAVEQARSDIASALNANQREIVFTSGATESDNLALTGVFERYANKGNRIIVSSVEHSAVRDTARRLGRHGADVVELRVDSGGRVNLDDLRAAVDDQTILISIIAAGNEIGTIQPIREIGRIARERGVLFHTDATQALCHLPLDVEADCIDLLSISAHKIYGPKGIGALYVRRHDPRVRLAPILHGGGHERGMRSGTLPVPLIVGFGRAVQIAGESMPAEPDRLRRLRDHLWERLAGALDDIHINGSMEHRLPNNLNVSFAYIEAEALLLGLDDIALSAGSACSSVDAEPSHVLRALGVREELANAAVRFGLGRSNTLQQVEYVADRVIEAVGRLRALSPLYDMAHSGNPNPALRGSHD